MARSVLIIHPVKIWLSKNSEVPVVEQLATQITLGIAAGDFAVGEKLPSTREIARRCGVHPNTVGAVYRRLTDQNLLEFRPGSGFYVVESAGDRIAGYSRLEQLITRFFEEARSLGFAEEEVRKRLKQRGRPRMSNGVTLLESDPGLRAILLYELSRESLPVSASSFEEFAEGRIKKTSLLIAMFDEKPKLDKFLKDGQKCVYLKGRSVSAAIAGEARPSENDLIAVVSGWDGFLNFARIMLLAVKIDPGNLVVRSTAEEGWKDAIRNASVVICDTLTAQLLSNWHSVRAFRIISDQSISEVRTALESKFSS